MNFRLLSRQLGIISLLIGGTMLFSLPWALPSWGQRRDIRSSAFEQDGAFALAISITICAMIGFLLIWCGRNARGRLFRREAMAVVGLSWVLATVLGALPYKFAGCMHTARIRMDNTTQTAQLHHFNGLGLSNWIEPAAPRNLGCARTQLKIIKIVNDI